MKENLLGFAGEIHRMCVHFRAEKEIMHGSKGSHLFGSPSSDTRNAPCNDFGCENVSHMAKKLLDTAKQNLKF